jgi:acyl dehydratase
MTDTLTWRLGDVEAAKMKTLALVLADPNPIHFDPTAASRLGTGGRLVNQGPSTIAMIYNLFAAELPGMRVKRLDVRLLGNILEGDAVTVEATATGETTYDVVVKTADGPKLTAVARLVARP